MSPAVPLAPPPMAAALPPSALPAKPGGDAVPTCSGGSRAIKGNISASGERIYHVPVRVASSSCWQLGRHVLLS